MTNAGATRCDSSPAQFSRSAQLPAVVHPLRPPQPRLLPHLHHRTQFQTLPHSRIQHINPSGLCSRAACCLPAWTFGLFAALIDSRSRSPVNTSFSVWTVSVLFFTISRSKTPCYILPAVPPSLAAREHNIPNFPKAASQKSHRLNIRGDIYRLAIAIARVAAHRSSEQTCPAP